jgi:TrkA domain protein
MADVHETVLPGVGARRGGRAVGVVSHQTGRRDLVVYDRRDPDAAADAVELTEEEARTLGELLGGSRIVERLEELPHQIEGLIIDWLHVAPTSSFAGSTLAECRVRERTGAAVVAIIRGHEAIPAPGGDDTLQAGDTAVVVGTRDGVEALSRLLEEAPERPSD